MHRSPPPARSPMFVPRLTLFILAGFAVFMLLALLYSLPVMLEEPPPDASPDYVQERVRAHLEGKTVLLMMGSFLIVGVAASRWKKP